MLSAAAYRRHAQHALTAGLRCKKTGELKQVPSEPDLGFCRSGSRVQSDLDPDSFRSGSGFPPHLVGSFEDADGGVGWTASVVDQAGVLGDADLPVSVVAGSAGASDVAGLLGALGVGVAVSLGAGG